MGQVSSNSPLFSLNSNNKNTQSSSTPTRIAFHKNHGEDIQLGDESAAVRVENRAVCWSNGLLFSSEPIKINQKIYVKLLVVSRTSHDVISIGFTSTDPEDVRYRETETQANSWTCSLSRYFCTEDAVLCFYVNGAGVIHYGKTNGQQFKVWDKQVDVTKPIWVVVHIWNEPTTIKLINENEVRQSVYGVQDEVDMGLECMEVKRRATRDVAAVTDPPGSDDNVCIICYTSDVEVVFVPCGHLCSCLECGRTIQRKDNLCPICRKTIGNVVRVYRA